MNVIHQKIKFKETYLFKKYAPAGIEPGSPAWKAEMLAITPLAQKNIQHYMFPNCHQSEYKINLW